jgi:hypothetical protein
MSKAAQGFSSEAYFLYVEGGNPRRTPLIGKIAIYGWKLIKIFVANIKTAEKKIVIQSSTLVFSFHVGII